MAARRRQAKANDGCVRKTFSQPREQAYPVELRINNWLIVSAQFLSGDYDLEAISCMKLLHQDRHVVLDGFFADLQEPQEHAMAKPEDGHIVETAMEARGAERGPTVRNVLTWGTGAVVAAFAVIYFIYY